MLEEKKELLRVEHLKKYFTTPKGTLHAVDDVNFSIRAGETLGVVGESGCGKSTMGRAILRLHEPTAGKVYFEGNDILGYNKKQLKELRKDMQIIFQDPFASLNPRMTVSEAIIEPLLVQGIYKSSERAAIISRVDEIMNLVGPQVHRVRRAGVRPGRIDPGPDSESDAGSSGGTEPDVHVYHPRPVRGPAFLQQYRGDVPGSDGGVCASENSV